jgi:hypothetical protein
LTAEQAVHFRRHPSSFLTSIWVVLAGLTSAASPVKALEALPNLAPSQASAPIKMPTPANTPSRRSAAVMTGRAVPSSMGEPAWTRLTQQQRQALSPLERDWPKLDSSRKSKWLEVATRFPTMPLADQQRVQERMNEWARMSPSERGRARLSFQQSKQFSPEEKQARWEAYQALPDDERQALANHSPPRGDRPRLPNASAPLSNGVQTKPADISRADLTAPASRPVAPTMVQAKPGATTTLMTVPAEPPFHHRAGQPRIAAKPGQVDRSTLLPKSGPQAPASSPPPP